MIKIHFWEKRVGAWLMGLLAAAGFTFFIMTLASQGHEAFLIVPSLAAIVFGIAESASLAHRYGAEPRHQAEIDRLRADRGI